MTTSGGEARIAGKAPRIAGKVPRIAGKAPRIAGICTYNVCITCAGRGQ